MEGRHPVFVYGSLLRGLGNHALLMRHQAAFLGEAFTEEATFSMVSLGAFPAICWGGCQRIKGEVYQVDDAGIAALDRLEGTPSFYKRERIAVVLDGERVMVWTYLLASGNSYRSPVPGGDWRAHIAAARGR